MSNRIKFVDIRGGSDADWFYVTVSLQADDGRWIPSRRLRTQRVRDDARYRSVWDKLPDSTNEAYGGWAELFVADDDEEED